MDIMDHNMDLWYSHIMFSLLKTSSLFSLNHPCPLNKSILSHLYMFHTITCQECSFLPLSCSVSSAFFTKSYLLSKTKRPKAIFPLSNSRRQCSWYSFRNDQGIDARVIVLCICPVFLPLFSLPYKQGPWVTFLWLVTNMVLLHRRYSINVVSEVKQ